jgi:hypothetical protein
MYAETRGFVRLVEFGGSLTAAVACCFLPLVVCTPHACVMAGLMGIALYMGSTEKDKSSFNKPQLLR